MIFLLAGAAIFTACKKDATTSTNAQKLIGKWSFVSNTSIQYHAGNVSHDTAVIIPTAYVDYRTDGKVYSFDGTTNHAYDTTAYKFISDNSFISGGDTLQIQSITSNSLVIIEKYNEPSSSFVITANLKK